MSDGETEAAVELAVRLGVLGRCSTCEHTWNLGALDAEDPEQFDALLVKACAKANEDPELGVFQDDDALGRALADAIEDAATERNCSHA